MAKEEKSKAKVKYIHEGGGNVVYFLGLLGALVYYIQQSNGFGEFIIAVLKAFVWPAFVVYDLLRFLG